MIRTGYEVADIQEAMVRFLGAKIAGGAPWSSWEVVEGWPYRDVLESTAKPVIYMHVPTMIEEMHQQGDGSGFCRWEMVVGGWVDRQKGGTEEAGIIQAQLQRLFNSASVNSTKFSGSIAGVAFTNKTLPEIGITIEGTRNPRVIELLEDDDFRGELSVILTA